MSPRTVPALAAGPVDGCTGPGGCNGETEGERDGREKRNTSIKKTGKPRLLWVHKKRVRALAFSPGGKLLASGSDDRTVRLWDAQTGFSTGVMTDCPWGVTSVAFSAADQTVAAVCHRVTGRHKGQAVAYLWATNKVGRRQFDLGRVPFPCPAFRPDGRVVALRCEDAVRLYDVFSGEDVGEIPEGGRGGALAFTPDGKGLVSGFLTGELHVWDVANGKQAQTLAAAILVNRQTPRPSGPGGRTTISGRFPCRVRAAAD